ncbi:MAG TPA: Do family serine endopeptidase [Bacteroidia bacterium]|jgi:serine protease Do|nr:Do family serine endopeptidase [Bacteroidia bacterium]
MKKIVSTVLVAALGGIMALTANHFIPDNQTAGGAFTLTQKMPVVYTGYSGGGVGNNPDFTMSAEKSLNAVVHIRTTASQNNNLNYNPFEQFLYGNSNRSYVLEGSGSGVILSDDGYVVTNNHVVNGADEINVMLNDKRSYSAEVIGTDPSTDIALLKIKEKGLPFISYGNSDVLKVGEWVLAVGNPFNLNSTVTAGIISAKGRSNVLEGDKSKGVFPIESFIQTDAAVNPGNSGGALVNTNGELIGINTAIVSSNGAYQGYSFAIPVSIVKKVVSDLIEFGTVQRAYIGVSIKDIDSKFAEQKNIKQLKGAYIEGLTSNGAAEAAGIKIGDVITAVENNKVTSVSELQEQVSKFRPGNKVNVTVMRDEKEITVPVTLTNLKNGTEMVKKEIPVLTSSSSLGATFEEVNKDYLDKHSLENGVKIAKLNGGKLASVGMKEGFVITSINKKKVFTATDVQKALENKTGNVLVEGIYPNGMIASYGFGL